MVIAFSSLDCFRQGAPTVDSMGNPVPGALTPAGKCPSPTCLKIPLTAASPPRDTKYLPIGYGLSTAACETDSDCVPESPCVTGFTCGVAMTVGQACCQKYCMCKDFLAIAPPPTPAACDASNPANFCCTLDGRAGNPMYPACSAAITAASQGEVALVIPVSAGTVVTVTPCLYGSIDPTNIDSNQPGLHLDCTVTDIQNVNSSSQTEAVVPFCQMQDATTPAAAGARPCWWAMTEPTNCSTTPTNLALHIERQGALSADTTIAIRCRTTPGT